ncbi:MAG: hypothetical protein ACJ8G1_15910 [Vitreoscilla sp.]
MSRQILLQRVHGPAEALFLDVATGRTAPAGVSSDAPAQGTLAVIEGQIFALYADQQVLWLQWNERRWPLTEVSMKYRHDLVAETTTFQADDRTITYPAWWRGDPTYEPLIPEQDELEDWLAYAMAVKTDPGLQAALLGGKA